MTKKNTNISKYDRPSRFKARLQRLLELADVTTVQLDTIEFRWSGPDFGWLELDILKNGEVALSVSVSYVYSPFYYVIPWLTRLATEDNLTSFLDLDIERVHLDIFCDYLGWRKVGKVYQDVSLFTLCLDLDDDDNHVDFIMPVKEFVRQFYYSIRDYFLTHKPVFMQEWFEYQYDDDCLERIEKDLTSAELEAHVPRKGQAPIIPEYETDIPQSDEEGFAKMDALLAGNPEMKPEDLYRWICDNWIFSTLSEDEELRNKRAAWFQKMSGGEIEFDYDWCFEGAPPAVNAFLVRYSNHLKEKQL